MAPVEITTVVFCEDIRREISNKDILIGVYSGNILLPSFPSTFNVAFWLEAVSNEVGPKELEFRIRLGGGGAVLNVGLNFAEPNQPAGIGLPTVQIMADKPDELFFEIRDGENWRVLKQKKVLQTGTPINQPTVSAPPS